MSSIHALSLIEIGLRAATRDRRIECLCLFCHAVNTWVFPVGKPQNRDFFSTQGRFFQPIFLKFTGRDRIRKQFSTENLVRTFSIHMLSLVEIGRLRTATRERI